jgi:NitT/TauT family transport system permease protein
MRQRGIRGLKKIRATLPGFVPVILVCCIWEITARYSLIPGGAFIPAFSQVVSTLFDFLARGILWESALSSLWRALAGMITGSVTGIAAGIALGMSPFLYAAFSPLIALLYPVPALGWLPILMIIFGIGDVIPVLLVFICSFFPLAYTTCQGIREVDPAYLNAAKGLGASKSRVLWDIMLPLALPSIFTGLKLEAGMAFRTIVAAEMIAIPTGLGALMMKGESLIRVDIILVALFTLSLISLAFERLIQYVAIKTVGKWKKKDHS